MPINERHFQTELSNLKKHLLSVGKLALSELARSLDALNDRNPELAQQVRASDAVLDAREVKVEEACLRLLALHQPLAQDLRYITSAIKINALIERTGDTAVKIADRAIFLSERPPLPLELDIKSVGQRVLEMFDRALQSFVNLDELEANQVMDMDAEVDHAYRHYTIRLITCMEQHPDQVETGLQMTHLMRHLERAADRAVDIAHQVLYILSGDISRHED